MTSTIKEIVELYITDPSKRTRSKIINNTKFMEHIRERFINKKSIKIDKVGALKFMCLLAGEELRRYNIKLEEYDNLEIYIAKILNIDLNKYVDDYAKKIADAHLNEELVDIEAHFENKIKSTKAKKSSATKLGEFCEFCN